MYQNGQTASVLESARHAFTSSAFPVVKFSHYQWTGGDPQRGLSCENPADGINVYVRNASNVPVYINSMHVTLRMGERQILEKAERILGSSASGINLAPGEVTAELKNGKDFKEYYTRLNGTNSATFLNFDVEVDYTSLPTRQCYQYRGTVTLLDSCHIPTQDHHYSSEKPIVQIPCK